MNTVKTVIFPLGHQPDPSEWRKDGRTTIHRYCCWGDIQVPAQVWESRLVGKKRHITTVRDGTLDHSGYTPQALDHLVTLARFLSYEDAAKLAPRLGLEITDSRLQRLVAPVAQEVRCEVRQELEEKALAPLERVPEAKKRVLVVQTDGCIVLGKRTGANVADPEVAQETGEAIEVKTATFYPQEAPSQRFTVAEVCTAEELMPLLAGGLRVIGVREQDELIGVSDGAVWIEERFKTLGVTQHVLDVFHAVDYVDTLMEEMGWSEQQRQEERRIWLRGGYSGRQWLETYVSASQKQKFSTDGQKAWHYLAKRTHLMDYPSYQQRGWPIGSGQIEGVNKSLIGGRMKGSGMHWSRRGASGMAALRTYGDNPTELIPFDTIRHRAYPIPA